MQHKDQMTRCFWIIRIMLSIGILLAGLYFAFTKSHFDTKYNKLSSFQGIEAIELEPGDTLEQKIYFEMEDVHSVGICAVNRTKNCTGSLDITISDENSALWKKTVNIEDLTLGKMVWFSVQQMAESQKEYTLKLSTEQMKGMIFIAGISEELNARGVTGNAVKSGTELGNALVAETTYRTSLNWKMQILIALWTVIAVVYILGFEHLFRNKTRGIITLFLTVDILAVSIYFRFGLQFQESFNYLMLLGLVGGFAVVAALYSFLLLHKNEKVELYFAISAFVFGMIFSVILPPFSAPDEDFHFTVAYRLSNVLMGQPINDEQGYIYMRECDIQNYERYPDNEYEIDIIKALIRGSKESSENIVASERNQNSFVPIIMYVPQAVGITIGRLLHFNYVRVVLLGRWMNLMTFIVITAFAIKLIPCGKWIFYAICQIPLLMEVVSSYSYDVLILAGSFLFIAYLIRLCRQDDKVSMKQMGILMLLAAAYGPLKPVYIPLLGLVFLIPDHKIGDTKWKSMGIKTFIVVLAAASFLLVNNFSFMSMRWIENETIAISAEVMYDESMVLEETEYYDIVDRDPCNRPNVTFLLENPLDIVESYMGAVLAFMDEYVLSAFGNYLGWYHIRIPVYISLLAMLLLYLSYVTDDGDAVKIMDNSGRLWTIFLVAGSCFAVFLTMYLKNTIPSNKSIIGVQGRYMIPIFAVLPLFLQRKHAGNEHNKASIVMLSLTIQVLAVLSVCMYIWSK